MNKINLVVTRHAGLVEYLNSIGMCGRGVEVIEHASPEDVKGRHVCGALPHSLSCLAASFTEVPLTLPSKLRGKELSADDIHKYASPPVTYIIRKEE